MSDGGKQHRMANVKLKDATKELVEEASGILEEATRIRKEADGLFDALKRLDSEMNRQAEEEAQRANDAGESQYELDGEGLYRQIREFCRLKR